MGYEKRAGTPRSRVQPARVIAAQTLIRVIEEDAYANLVLPAELSRARLDPRDAAFATELTYGTLRYQAQLDWVLKHVVNRRLERLDTAVLVVARLAAYQVLHTRVPDHAAVAQSVELAKEVAGRGTDKFINGVGRALVEQGANGWERLIGKIDDNLERVAIQYSHPRWMIRQFAAALEAHGRDARELEELLAANNAHASVTMCARPGQILPAELADDAEYFLRTKAHPGDYSEWSVIIDGGDPGRLFAVRDGRAAVQDEASQLVTTALASAEIDAPDDDWLDMCAGPGGKAGLLAAFADYEGAHLDANEVAEHRARLVANTLAPFPDVNVEVGDGRRIGADRPGKYQRILLDAPCTGLGSLRRRPESRWRRQLSDLADLTALQSELFDSAFAALAPGGILGYVTCSPLEAETVAQVRAANERHANLRVLDTGALVGQVSMSPLGTQAQPVGEGNTIQMWPHLHGTDAMFLALVTKERD